MQSMDSVQTPRPGQADPISLGDALTLGQKVAPDVTRLLMQDHAEAMAYFDWASASSGRERADIVAKLCTALSVHMAVEEEILYPAALDALEGEGEDLVEHAYEEHNEAKAIIKKLSAGKGAKTGVPALLKKLRATIAHHVEEEHTKLFPKLRASDMDLYAVGADVAVRRMELLFELTGRRIPPSALAEAEGPAN